MRKGMIFGLAALAAAAGATVAAPGTARAAGEGIPLPSFEWSFDGIFGTYDRASVQRGLQVYRAVCAGCHSMDYIAFRNLAELGYSEDEIKAMAAEAIVIDGPNDEGEMFERAGLPFDYFPAPFPNPQAAAFANGGALPPDLSLMAKARANGPNYLLALMGHGYEDQVSDETLQQIFALETEKRQVQYEAALENYETMLEVYEERVEAGEDANRPDPPEEPQPVESIEDLGLSEGLSFNAYFPGYGIAMAMPLFDDGVEYADGTPATVEQMATDVANFLMWTAEPKLEDRKGMGIKVILFLLVFTGILYAAKRKVWADVH